MVAVSITSSAVTVILIAAAVVVGRERAICLMTGWPILRTIGIGTGCTIGIAIAIGGASRIVPRIASGVSALASRVSCPVGLITRLLFCLRGSIARLIGGAIVSLSGSVGR